MSRTDRSNINQNLSSSSSTRFRKKGNEGISVQTNTDPWQPQCRTCLQNQSSQFVFEDNTIDMNEYVKAINYINSIHALINETLLSKDQGRNSNLNVKANVSMPDLPNFLTLLTSISNLHNNARSTLSCQRISRTTSTSSLSKKFIITDTQQQEEEEEGNKYKKGEDFEKEDLLNLKKIGHGDQGEDEVPDSELYQEEQSKTDTYYIARDEECSCIQCTETKHIFEEGNKATTTTTKQDRVLENTKKPDQYYDVEMKTNISEHEINSINLQRKKGTPEISLKYQNTTKCTCDKQNKTVGETRRRRFEPVLSDAELDRYASELLVDVDWEESSVKSGDTAFTFSIPIAKHPIPESIKTPKTRLSPSPEQGKKKIVSKPKEVPQTAPSDKQKSFTHIPVKQNVRGSSPSNKRSNSRSCSPVKNKTSTSPVRPGSPNRSARKHSKTDSVNHVPNNEGWATVYSEKQDPIKTVKAAMTIPKPKILNFQLPSLTSLEKSKICPKQQQQQHTQPCSSTSLTTQQNHIAFQAQKKLQENNAKKVYKIQQKEDDDFICSRKTFKSHLLRKASDSVIMSDKEDHPNNDMQHQDVCETNNNNNINQKAFTFQSKASSHCNVVQSSPRKPSRNDLDVTLQQDVQRSNEHFIVSMPPSRRRKDVRNKPFRQARRQSGDSEDIVHLRDYTTPYKQMNNESDTNSNDTGSSDIKSDKESPSQLSTSPLILNYANPSREHI